MSVSYRNNFSNYLQEHQQNYAPIGSIFPVSVDSFSAPEDRNGAGSGGEDPEYGYKGYLYCDGRTLNIRDYPHLYNAIRNTYGGSASVAIKNNNVSGSIRRTYWINNKMFINFYKDDAIPTTVKRPYPNGVLFRFRDDTGFTPAGPGLGSLGTSIFGYDILYGTKEPTENTDSNTPAGEYAYEIIFPEGVNVGGLPQTSTNVTAGTHPSVIISKSFNFRDFPYNIGTFSLPDYRDRVVVGVGGVDGEGSPTVENALINEVGQYGGNWYISKDTVLDGGLFFSVGDVKTRGYTNIRADIFTYLTGSVEFRVGPTGPHTFSRPAEHFHNILGSEADELTNSEFTSVPVDEFAAMYTTTRASVTPFEPVGNQGLPLSHSHGIVKDALNDPSSATYGNTSGIGGYDPNTPADIFWDVSDPDLISYLNPLGDGRIGYDDVSLEAHGPGTGEWEGFEKPPIAQSNVYLAFGYGATATGFSNPGELKRSRRVEYNLDFTGYTQLYVYAIAGNDNNGGERPNNPNEGLYCQFSNGESLRLFPSVQDFKAENGLPGAEAFDLYDAIHSQWKEFVIDIPAALQDQPNQVITLKQDLYAGSEQDSGVPAGNLNANDMIGIQGIGLRGGIEQPAVNVPGVYPITGSPLFLIDTLQYDASTSTVLVTLSEQHTLDIGQFVSIGGVSPAGFNGDYEIIADDFSNQEFRVSVDSSPGSTTGTGGTVRLALGRFEDQIVLPPPRLYAIDSSTQIAKKKTTIVIPGTGVIFQTGDLTTAGTLSFNPVAASAGEVTNISVDLYGPGGGGANSSTDGTDAGYAYATFEIDGQSFTVYAGGGTGGQDGNSGGSAGDGGSVTIPALLTQAPYNQFVEIVQNTAGADGTAGGGDGPGSAAGGLGGYSTGGDGTYETIQQTVDGDWVTYNASGSYTISSGTNVVSSSVQIQFCGGGGGGGNGNANSRCQGSGANGGQGGPGAVVSGTVLGTSSFSWILGGGGATGFNLVDGDITGGTSEGTNNNGGGGSASGGGSERGAWGNGATGGAGGGCTGVYADNGNAMAGAGGGGGGGGSGGGYNGNKADGCYAGDNWRNANVGLQEVSNSLGFAGGEYGALGGCTAGSGGGGGGSAGPSGSAQGGQGGTAGAGHNGNGGGTGGRQGDSAWRNTYIANATISNGSNGGSPGNNGGMGYMKIKKSETIEYAGKIGGGGGAGAVLMLLIKDKNIPVTVGLQSPGGGAATGGAGYCIVDYRGTEGGGEADSSPTNAVGRYYECDSSGVPSGSPFNDGVWIESSANGDVEDNYVRPVSPGLGTGSIGGFTMPTSGNGTPPKYGGRSTKYLPFSGPGTREYVMGPIDTRAVNKLRFSVAKGTSFNGGETPNEDLMVYYRESGGTTTTLLDAIITSSESLNGWEEKDILVPETSNARGQNIEFIIRQTRPSGQGDNANVTSDNYGISAVTFFYDEITEQIFVPSNGQTIEGVDYVDDIVTSTTSGIVVTEGSFEMSSSTPISTTALVSPESNIPLATRYHRAKYLIKAR